MIITNIFILITITIAVATIIIVIIIIIIILIKKRVRESSGAPGKVSSIGVATLSDSAW